MDGIIIGGGLAGLMAGITAQAAGKSTLIISAGVGSIVYAFGPLHFGNIRQLKERVKHPYRVLADSVPAACAAFLHYCPAYGGDWEKSTPVLTPLGERSTAHLFPRHMSLEKAAAPGTVGLVEPEGLKDFFPPMIGRILKETFPQSRIRPVPLDMPAYAQWIGLGKTIPPAHYVKYWTTGEGQDHLARFIAELNEKRHKDGERVDILIFPCLGGDFSPEIGKILERSAVPVIELSSFPPTGTGQALHKALVDRYKALGGELILGTKAVRGECAEGFCRGLRVESKGRSSLFQARNYVLATGGIMGGGILAAAKEAKESVFGLPLYVPAQWTNDQFLGPQPYALTGVEVDERLRPVDPNSGAVRLENVRVVGRMLAHWDPWVDHCGGGVAITSGYMAGKGIGGE